MSTDVRKALLERAEAARIDYGLALTQILDDALAAGIPAHHVLPDLALAAWSREVTRKSTAGSVYFAKADGRDIVKVGFSTSVADRIRALRQTYGCRFEVLGTVAGTMDDERRFHRLLRWCQDETIRGREFFRYSACRGLVRLFIGCADTFPWTGDVWEETRTWVTRATDPTMEKHDREIAHKVLGTYFEQQAALSLGEA
jgi:hypothetical protein